MPGAGADADSALAPEKHPGSAADSQGSQVSQGSYPSVICIEEGVASLGLVGLFLGWQAALTVAAIVLMMAVLASISLDRFTGRGGTLAGKAFVATLIFLGIWRWIAWSV